MNTAIRKAGTGLRALQDMCPRGGLEWIVACRPAEPAISIVGLCLLPLPEVNLKGQTQTPPSQDFPFRILNRVEEVRRLFNVADKHGRPIVNLEPEDVVVVDDGQPVSSFTDCSRPTGLPRLTMLVDASASMAGYFLAERAAAQRMRSAWGSVHLPG
jgi:hypothetical protein